MRAQLVVFATTISVVVLAGAPVPAFEIFGFKFFEPAQESKIEVLDPQTYRLDFLVEGDADLRASLRAASDLWQGRNDPASGSAGLIATARGDYAAILAALYRAGYYGGSIDIRAGGQEVNGLSLFQEFADDVPVTVAVNPGPRFVFGDLQVQNPAGEGVAGFAAGRPARSGAIETVAGATIAAWRDRGHAKAALAGQEIVADHGLGRLDVALAFDPGPAVRFGLVTAEGSETVDADFIRYMADISPGTRFSPAAVEAARARLGRLEVFSAVRVLEAESLAEGNSLPLTIAVQDRPLRRFGIGATFSSIDGLALEGFWLHRNLFGKAEQLRLGASIAGIDGAYAYDRYDYELTAELKVPGVLSPDTDLRLSGEARHLNLAGYEDDSFTLAAGLSHIFSGRLTGTLAAELQRSRFTTGLAVDELTIASALAGLIYDSRDDDLDAHSGRYLDFSISPYLEIEIGGSGLSLSAEGRAYQAFGENGKYVLAGRARLASLIGPDIAGAPADRLYFAGGGGSVRGYGYKSIGTSVPGGDPAGGLSLAEVSLELRARLSGKWGVAGFVDAGLVGAKSIPDGDERFAAGAGLGLRYFTGLGPLRVDLAVPLDGGGAAYALYIGIGQAF